MKQARPALERFPEYQVSTERIVFEQRYGERARPFDRDGVLPGRPRLRPRGPRADPRGPRRRRAHGPRARAGRGRSASAAARLGALPRPRPRGNAREPGLANAFANDAMRRLHGDHIFVLPLRENDFPPRPAALARAPGAARRRRAGAHRRRRLRALPRAPGRPRPRRRAGGQRAARRRAEPKLLDAEIAHVGDPAFDLGTLLAHLVLPGAAQGRLGAALPRRPRPATPTAGPTAPARRRSPTPCATRASSCCGARSAPRASPAVERGDAALAVLAQAEAWIRRPPADLASLRRRLSRRRLRGCGRRRRLALPADAPVVEAAVRDHVELHDLEVRREVEVARASARSGGASGRGPCSRGSRGRRCGAAAAPARASPARRSRPRGRLGGRIGKRTRWKSWPTRLEQITSVGTPLPKWSAVRRKRSGTRLTGSR